MAGTWIQDWRYVPISSGTLPVYCQSHPDSGQWWRSTFCQGEIPFQVSLGVRQRLWELNLGSSPFNSFFDTVILRILSSFPCLLQLKPKLFLSLSCLASLIAILRLWLPLLSASEQRTLEPWFQNKAVSTCEKQAAHAHYSCPFPFDLLSAWGFPGNFLVPGFQP